MHRFPLENRPRTIASDEWHSDNLGESLSAHKHSHYANRLRHTRCRGNPDQQESRHDANRAHRVRQRRDILTSQRHPHLRGNEEDHTHRDDDESNREDRGSHGSSPTDTATHVSRVRSNA